MIDKDSFSYTCYKYLEDYVVAKYVAFYISSEYHNKSIGNSSFMQHFNSAADIFNIEFENKDKVICDVKKILEENYRLKIVQEKPLILQDI